MTDARELGRQSEGIQQTQQAQGDNTASNTPSTRRTGLPNRASAQALCTEPLLRASAQSFCTGPLQIMLGPQQPLNARNRTEPQAKPAADYELRRQQTHRRAWATQQAKRRRAGCQVEAQSGRWVEVAWPLTAAGPAAARTQLRGQQRRPLTGCCWRWRGCLHRPAGKAEAPAGTPAGYWARQRALQARDRVRVLARDRANDRETGKPFEMRDRMAGRQAPVRPPQCVQQTHMQTDSRGKRHSPPGASFGRGGPAEGPVDKDGRRAGPPDVGDCDVLAGAAAAAAEAEAAEGEASRAPAGRPAGGGGSTGLGAGVAPAAGGFGRPTLGGAGGRGAPGGTGAAPPGGFAAAGGLSGSSGGLEPAPLLPLPGRPGGPAGGGGRPTLERGGGSAGGPARVRHHPRVAPRERSQSQTISLQSSHAGPTHRDHAHGSHNSSARVGFLACCACSTSRGTRKEQSRQQRASDGSSNNVSCSPPGEGFGPGTDPDPGAGGGGGKPAVAKLWRVWFIRAGSNRTPSPARGS
jgi:hypothetical protein